MLIDLMKTRRFAFALALILTLGSCSLSPSPRPSTRVAVFEVGGGVIGPGDGVGSPGYDVPSWFSGIWLTNTSTNHVVLRSAEVRRVDPDIRIVNILFARGSELPANKQGAFSGECGAGPPRGFNWHDVSGLEVLPGERIFPLVGVDDGPGSIRDIRITYTVADDEGVLTQDFYFLAEVRGREKEVCPNK